MSESPCRSMTGYGRGEARRDELSVVVELRSVNHRFLDTQLKIPRAYLALESELVGVVKERCRRGRVELFLRRELSGGGRHRARVDSALVRSIAEAVAALDGVDGTLRVADLLDLPGVLEIVEDEGDLDSERAVVLEAAARAGEALATMRAREGAALAADVSRHLDDAEAAVDRLRALAQERPELIRQRLLRRVEELLGDAAIDPARLAQEAALLADKADVTEELDRLRSHFEQARALLVDPEPVGRRLDFLVQEMNREVNTIGSKGSDATIAAVVVELKSVVERVREQVANLE